MLDHPVPWLLGVLAGFAVAVITAFAARVQALPDVIDISIIPTGAGVGGLLAALCGAALRFEPDRLARVTLFGNSPGRPSPSAAS